MKIHFPFSQLLTVAIVLPAGDPPDPGTPGGRVTSGAGWVLSPRTTALERLLEPQRQPED